MFWLSNKKTNFIFALLNGGLILTLGIFSGHQIIHLSQFQMKSLHLPAIIKLQSLVISPALLYKSGFKLGSDSREK